MLDTLYYYLHQIDDAFMQNDTTHVSQLVVDYYKQLYMLAGDMELVWDSLQKADVDLRRLLYLAVRVPAVAQGFLHELNGLTAALIERDNDKACQIYTSHMSRIPLLLSPLQQRYSEYFCSEEQADL